MPSMSSRLVQCAVAAGMAAPSICIACWSDAERQMWIRDRLSRVYRCLLKLYAAKSPELFVMDPDPKVVAVGRVLPHTYPHDGAGTKLCLWLPKAHEWSGQMRLDETYLPWAAEWLDYFEEWLVTDDWSGGGAHPAMKPRRWARRLTLRPVHAAHPSNHPDPREVKHGP